MINKSRMLEITGGDKELEKELLTLFLETANSTLMRLQAGENWQRTVHELKGAAANIGMDTFPCTFGIYSNLPSKNRSSVSTDIALAPLA